jgi:hypothetical protein
MDLKMAFLKLIKVKKILLRLLDDTLYCELFHTKYGTSDNKMWRCPKCGTLTQKRLSDNDTGPK